jgi:hypothetical protein
MKVSGDIQDGLSLRGEVTPSFNGFSQLAKARWSAGVVRVPSISRAIWELHQFVGCFRDPPPDPVRDVRYGQTVLADD